MPDDDKKEEMKKEADALQKLMKDVGKKFEGLRKLAQGDAIFMNMIKMQDVMMKMQMKQMKTMMKMLK